MYPQATYCNKKSSIATRGFKSDISFLPTSSIIMVQWCEMMDWSSFVSDVLSLCDRKAGTGAPRSSRGLCERTWYTVWWRGVCFLLVLIEKDGRICCSMWWFVQTDFVLQGFKFRFFFSLRNVENVFCFFFQLSPNYLNNYCELHLQYKHIDYNKARPTWSLGSVSLNIWHPFHNKSHTVLFPYHAEHLAHHIWGYKTLLYV